ncbi:MAG: hypothetical protein V7K89_26995 [Nostoc sp.]|uniref:hypothetical protein n=1 Tax=Nostoc sp. TaxID=1180 RepID=UPI002FF71D93
MVRDNTAEFRSGGGDAPPPVRIEDSEWEIEQLSSHKIDPLPFSVDFWSEPALRKHYKLILIFFTDSRMNLCTKTKAQIAPLKMLDNQ